MTLHCVIRTESVMETFPEVHWPGSLDSVYLLKTIWTLEVFYVLSSVISSQETMFICKLELFILLPCWALCVWWGNYRNSHVIDKTFLPLYLSWRISQIMSFVCLTYQFLPYTVNKFELLAGLWTRFVYRVTLKFKV